MEQLKRYQAFLEPNLAQTVGADQPGQLYDPLRYILGLGGKRLRPILTLMTCEYFGGKQEDALHAALAVELFHNFSLIHDDIMDKAPLRRGKTTVHEKWDLNTGILSGDAMLILAYRHFENYEAPVFAELAKLFSKTALEVCEGQQYDIDFEELDEVSLDQYIRMIEYKTAVLVGASMQMGAIIAGAPAQCKESIYQFGRNLGIAFQIQDDYLDAFADPKSFGKQVGGDIIAGKKTYLYLKALELANSSQRAEMMHLNSIRPKDPGEKIELLKQIFIESGAVEATKEAITTYSDKAFELLETISIGKENREHLRKFGNWLMQRDF
jgi:geranylgeranyl diphosphate synthase type II